MIYTKQINESWTLCDENGNCVNLDGDLTYVPLFYDKKPEGFSELVVVFNKKE